MTTDVADLLDRQGVRLESTWRATRVALGGQGVAQYLLGEVLTAAPSAVLVALVIPQFSPAFLVWALPVGLAWFSRDGRATAFGCIFSLVAVLVFGALGARLFASPFHFLGAFCVPWTWSVGAAMRGAQKIAIVERLAGNHALYDRLRASAAISGPSHISFDTPLVS
jgi:hypothetical protein